MNKNTDHIGQEFELGDWAAITQNNEVHVGKIVSISKAGAPTICRDSVEEWAMKDPVFKKIDKTWRGDGERKKAIQNKFPGHSGYVRKLSYCRDKKFVIINPTDAMIIAYDK